MTVVNALELVESKVEYLTVPGADETEMSCTKGTTRPSVPLGFAISAVVPNVRIACEPLVTLIALAIYFLLYGCVTILESICYYVVCYISLI